MTRYDNQIVLVTLADFTPGQDVLDLSGTGFDDFDLLQFLERTGPLRESSSETGSPWAPRRRQ